MHLDDLQIYTQLDPDGMLTAIMELPKQLEQGWVAAQTLKLPVINHCRAVVICGMGGSAIAGDFVSAYLGPESPVPILVSRDYDLPAWVTGEDILVISSSHSGNTEETLSTYSQAQERGCTQLALCTGGKLATLAGKDKVALWTFNHSGQPRTAVGYSFITLLALLSRLGLALDPGVDLAETLSILAKQASEFGVESPVSANPAKRMAGQLLGRSVAVFGSGLIAPVARRWKTQINELAKAWAQYEELPEADHNLAAAVVNPEAALTNTMAVFLQAPSDHPRNALRSVLTRKGFMLEGIGTDTVVARGDSRLAHLWSLIQYGDFMSYYLAIAYGVNPTPVEAIESLKKAMK